MGQQISSLSLNDQMDNIEEMREKTTSLPLLDQHVSLVKEHLSWWLPAAGGILAVGLSFSDPILEYIDLNTGLFRNVLESVSGKRILLLLIRPQYDLSENMIVLLPNIYSYPQCYFLALF